MKLSKAIRTDLAANEAEIDRLEFKICRGFLSSAKSLGAFRRLTEVRRARILLLTPPLPFLS